MHAAYPPPPIPRPAPMVHRVPMYAFSIDREFYEARKDGTPITLAECWRECYGVRGAAIWRIGRDGRLSLVLDKAGEATGRVDRVRKMYRAKYRPNGRPALSFRPADVVALPFASPYPPPLPEMRF